MKYPEDIYFQEFAHADYHGARRFQGIQRFDGDNDYSSGPRTSTATLGWVITSSPDAALMWQLNLSAGATLTMANVLVKYSDARAHPVAAAFE